MQALLLHDRNKYGLVLPRTISVTRNYCHGVCLPRGISVKVCEQSAAYESDESANLANGRIP